MSGDLRPHVDRAIHIGPSSRTTPRQATQVGLYEQRLEASTTKYRNPASCCCPDNLGLGSKSDVDEDEVQFGVRADLRVCLVQVPNTSMHSSRADFDFIKPLGTGSYVVVWQAVRKHDGRTYAVKELDLRYLQKQVGLINFAAWPWYCG